MKRKIVQADCTTIDQGLPRPCTNPINSSSCGLHFIIIISRALLLNNRCSSRSSWLSSMKLQLLLLIRVSVRCWKRCTTISILQNSQGLPRKLIHSTSTARRDLNQSMHTEIATSTQSQTIASASNMARVIRTRPRTTSGETNLTRLTV